MQVRQHHGDFVHGAILMCRRAEACGARLLAHAGISQLWQVLGDAEEERVKQVGGLQRGDECGVCVVATGVEVVA